jgi:hypothetical protein
MKKADLGPYSVAEVPIFEEVAGRLDLIHEVMTLIHKQGLRLESLLLLVSKSVTVQNRIKRQFLAAAEGTEDLKLSTLTRILKVLKYRLVLVPSKK